MNPNTPQYDFNHDVFRQNLKYKRWAREHLQLASLQSDVIQWEIAQTVSPLHIPVLYHVHYHFKSIVGIKEDLNPLYADHHVLELSIPEQYPLEGCKINMLTDVWHPNIRSDGKFKGRVCGNTDSFGLTYDLYQLVLRVGEILQYKNYHAVHTPPYPEDSNVAQWVIDFAEPNGIVDKTREIAVDDTPLVRPPVSDDNEAVVADLESQPTEKMMAPVPESLSEFQTPPLATPPWQMASLEPVPESLSELQTPPVAASPLQMASSDPEPEPEPISEFPLPNAGQEDEGSKIKIGRLRQNVEQKQKITITPKD